MPHAIRVGDDKDMNNRVTLIAGVAVSASLFVVVITMCIVVWRDGNSPLVDQAMHLLAGLVTWTVPVLLAATIGNKGIDALLAFLAAKLGVPVAVSPPPDLPLVPIPPTAATVNAPPPAVSAPAEGD